jgi:hypothetical protein
MHKSFLPLQKFAEGGFFRLSSHSVVLFAYFAYFAVKIFVLFASFAAISVPGCGFPLRAFGPSR